MGCGASTVSKPDPPGPKPTPSPEPKPKPPDPGPAPSPEPEPKPRPIKEWWKAEVDLSYPVVRKSAHDVTPDEEDRIVAAWRKLTENKDGVPGSSEYFRLGVIHGGTESRASKLEGATPSHPNYCVHGPECFPNWHRIYMTNMELSLRRADLALGNDGQIFLPYFDWTKKPAGKPMLPMLLQRIMATDSYEGVPSEGGLFHDTFFPLDKDGTQLAPRERDGTLFYKTTKWTPALDEELEKILHDKNAGALGGWGSVPNLKEGETLPLHAVWDAMRRPNHKSASSALEANPHGWMHVAIGMLGNTLPGTEMVGAVPTAGFHPIFWMHHCNVDRVYESILHTPLGKTFEEDFKERMEDADGGPTAVAFPKGQWGPFMPFGINPKMGKQYDCADTFDTAGLGFKYADLYELPAVDVDQMMRELPLVCVFRDINKMKVAGSKALFIYVSDGSWVMPADLAPLKPDALKKLPGYAGFASLFIFPEAEKCDNCLKNAPTVTVTLDITASVRKTGLPRAKAKVDVIVYDLYDKVSATLEQSNIAQPTLEGPAMDSESLDNENDISALQGLLNDGDDDPGVPGEKLEVSGTLDDKTVEALKKAQAAAGLEPTGKLDAKTRQAMRIANMGSHLPAGVKPCAEKCAKAGTVVEWRLAEKSVPPCLGSKEAVAAELAVAFAEWGAAMEGVTFQRVTDPAKAQVTIRFDDRTPQNKLAFDGPGGALAATTPEAITFDASERWELFSGGPKHPQRGQLPGEYFFELLPVAIHEIGHLLGLGHSSETADVMSPFYNRAVKLTDNDKARVKALLAEVAVSA